MKKHGFDWPEILKCSKFPKKSEEMCLEKPRPKKIKKKTSKESKTTKTKASS